MRILELFSGTGSVGKVAKDKFNMEVISVDNVYDATFMSDILSWDYKQYKPGYFDIIWASPPCANWSILQYSWIGRKNKKGVIITKEIIQEKINQEGKPLVDKTLEIIEYFKPKSWFIENPASSKMKDYIKLPNVVVSYCKYSDWGYQKNTRIWTNVTHFEPKKCSNKDPCDIINRHEEYPNRHKIHLGGVRCKTTREEKYRIPPLLVFDLLHATLENPTS